MQKITIWAPSHNFLGLYLRKACVDNRKKNLLSSNISSRCRYNMVNFGPLTAEIDWRVWGTPSYQQVSRLGSVTARQSSSGRQPNCGVEQRAPPMFGRATTTLGIGPHSSWLICWKPVKQNRLYIYELFMVALWNRETIYIFMLWFVLSSFFPRLISAAADWMFAILPHMVWP